jgi:hypothetical protein
MTTTLEDRLRSTFADVAATTDVGPVPGISSTTPVARRRRVRRLVVAGSTAGALVIGGLGVAAATNVIPRNAAKAFFGFGTAHISQSRLIASYPGPGSEMIQAFVAPAAHGQQCVAFHVIPSTKHRPSEGGACASVDTSQFATGGGGVGQTTPTADIQLFAVTAGRAATAEVQVDGVPEGDAVVSNGWIAGWFPDSTHADLIARDANGNVIATLHGMFTAGPEDITTP